MVGVKSSSTDDAKDVVLAHDQVRLVVDLDFGASVVRNENFVSLLHGQIDFLAVVVDFTGAKSDDFAFLRFFLCGIGNNDPAFFHFLLFNRLHQHPISKRFYIDCCHMFYCLLLVFGLTRRPFISNGRRQNGFVYFFLSSSTTSNSASTTSPSPPRLPAPSSAPGRAPASGPGCGPAWGPGAAWAEACL